MSEEERMSPDLDELGVGMVPIMPSQTEEPRDLSVKRKVIGAYLILLIFY